MRATPRPAAHRAGRWRAAIVSATARARAPSAVLVKTWPKLSETFILEEVLGLERLGVPLRLYALAPPTDAVAHAGSRRGAGAACACLRWRERRRRGCIGAHLSSRWRAAALPGATLQASAPREHGLARLPARGAGSRAQLRARRRRAPACALHRRAGRRRRARPSRLAGLPFSHLGARQGHLPLATPPTCAASCAPRASPSPAPSTTAARWPPLAPEARVHRMYHGIDHGAFAPRAAGAAAVGAADAADPGRRPPAREEGPRHADRGLRAAARPRAAPFAARSSATARSRRGSQR